MNERLLPQSKVVLIKSVYSEIFVNRPHMFLHNVLQSKLSTSEELKGRFTFFKSVLKQHSQADMYQERVIGLCQ